MQLKSSRGIRRFINRFIRFLNHQLPVSEQIEYIALVPFSAEEELEIVVMQYAMTVYDIFAESRDGQGAGDASYVRAKDRIADLEARYGIRLDKYLKPYENPQDLASSMERRRAQVAQERKRNRRT